ncbi:hypothetical protein ANOBCDAF_02511 [Pleomorphomonas sp. T1.2MG-36]|uniref:DUF952 domain-containing protein n=1 Tax=Pleomorphomonas sp. T1.2MG-36 TaxID=3041167 RepID=UPI002477C27F|nr:DUF952 domain-containing protein [Pleomorphomonas sp. T1.2MG-36]CAI9411699.1 hypothetical protein ANOBCDAF_02511 [Pleomorphomonas sp. T1.2MG-36]
MDRLVYKIAPRALWEAAEATGVFAGASVDFEDGFIHLSSAAQVRETARLYFAGQGDLLLIGVGTAALGEALKWEPSRGGDLFPHLYAPLEFSAVDFVVPLPLGPDGVHQFPDLETGR